MKKILVVSLLLLLLCLTLTACNNPFTLDFGWKKAELTAVGNDVIYWQGDEKADYYKVVIKDSRNVTTSFDTADEYFVINDVAPDGDYTVEVVKYRGIFKYHSAPISLTNMERNRTVVSRINKLHEMIAGDSVYFGSLQSTEALIIFSDLMGADTFDASTTICVNPTLEVLWIQGNGSQSLANVRIKVLDRTTPLTIRIKDIELSSNQNDLIYYDGESDFECNIVALGTTSFVNTAAGKNGSNGSNAQGLTSAGNGGNGGNGGGIFNLPRINMFCESTPTFITGDGGRGGNGGTGTNLAHGGYGGSGGNGGYVFTNSTVTCFNGSYVELTGSYGTGGKGGSGGSGISGTRSGGSSGSAGGLTLNSTIQYVSRTDGVKKDSPDGGSNPTDGFGISYLNGYLVWNEQDGATSYNVMRGNTRIGSAPFNAYYIGELSSSYGNDITVRVVGGTSDGKTSRALKVYDAANTVSVTPQIGTMTVTGNESVMLDAALLTNTDTITVSPDVKRIVIANANEEITRLYLRIVANSRTDNLIVELDNVSLFSSTKAPAIVLNNGTGSSNAKDPMLIINSYNSIVCGADGARGSTGRNQDSVLVGGTGGDGQDGFEAIKAPITVIMGDSFDSAGGSGGDGGDGGYSTLNDGGNGGNGGNGAVAINTRMCYIIMNANDSRVLLAGGQAGRGGDGGDGFFGGSGSALNSAKPGKSGASTVGITAEYKIYTGTITNE